jgi:hypothetical protein
MTLANQSQLTEQARDRGIFMAMRGVPMSKTAETWERIEELVEANWRNEMDVLCILAWAAYHKKLDEYATRLEQNFCRSPGETDMFLAQCYLELGMIHDMRPAGPTPAYWREYAAFCEAAARNARNENVLH